MRKQILMIGITLLCLTLVFSGCINQTATQNPEDEEKLVENYEPVATIKADKTEGRAPLVVSFEGTGTDKDGAIIHYEWNFDDGDSTIEQNPTHTFFEPGEYTVKLVVIDNFGAINTETIQIIVH